MSFKESDKGKFALLHKRELITICDSHSACYILGDNKYTDGLYLVQEIGHDYEEDLGFHGCVFVRWSLEESLTNRIEESFFGEIWMSLKNFVTFCYTRLKYNFGVV